MNNAHVLETIVGTVSRRTYWPGQVIYVVLYFVVTNYVSVALRELLETSGFLELGYLQ
jgi:hypothetical protein